MTPNRDTPASVPLGAEVRIVDANGSPVTAWETCMWIHAATLTAVLLDLHEPYRLRKDGNSNSQLLRVQIRPLR